MPTVAKPAAAGKVDRSKTVIFDIDGGRVLTPDLWNPWIPTSSRRDHGFHQAVLEPLFILNYESGKIDGWIGESMTSNDALDVWTMKLRKGVTWQDGVPFTADDVVFTIQTLIAKAPELNDAAALKEWVKLVEKVDDLTIKFTLNKPNPRFQLDYFSVKIWGSPNIMPKHIWEGQDPLTFKNYDPGKGWPVGTGAYKLASISPTEFTYVRDDNWWGAKTGFKPLPAPEKLIWTWAGPEETRTALMADGQLDSLMDVTLGAFKALKARNPNVIAWNKDLPYAWLDPCDRTFDDKDMRWAVNYAIDRDQILKVAYEGTTYTSKFIFPAYPPLNKYVKLLEDGGSYTKYPLMTHDAAKAKQIIESKGYTMGGDGYYAKDGKTLQMLITTHEAFIEKQRWLKPVGERADANGWRWKNEEYSKIVDQIGTMPLGDPKINDLFVKASEIYLSELPVIPITQAKKLIPFDTTYWTNWPTADNNYLHATTWWQSTHVIIDNLKPAKR